MSKPDFDVSCGFCNKALIIKRKRFLDGKRNNADCLFFCNKECNILFKKSGAYIECLVCKEKTYKSKHEIEEGSKFCSHSCSASFNNKLKIINGVETTKGKTKQLNCSKCQVEITCSVNSPITKILCDDCVVYSTKYRKVPLKSNVEKECKKCNSKMTATIFTKYCDSCRSLIRSENSSNSVSIRVNNGTLFSQSIRCEFDFNGDKIRCDSKLEYVCLYWFVNNFNVAKIKRSEIVISYVFNSKNKKYYPDFDITLKDGSKYMIECKGVVGKKLSVKWGDYNLKSVEKKNALNKRCKDNQYISYWFSQQEHSKLYAKLRTSIIGV